MCKLRSCRVEQEDTVAGRYPRERSAREGVSVLGCRLEACGMPDLREICREQTLYVNKQSLLRLAGGVTMAAADWNGARKWGDKRRKAEQASKEGKWTVMWVGDYRQKAPAAACDLKKRSKDAGGRLARLEASQDRTRS